MLLRLIVLFVIVLIVVASSISPTLATTPRLLVQSLPFVIASIVPATYT